MVQNTVIFPFPPPLINKKKKGKPSLYMEVSQIFAHYLTNHLPTE
jgi:hypothetical protein